MKLEKRKPSGREKDEATIEVLERLRDKLYCDSISHARRTAFNLSWMQEDGLEILKEALFNCSPRRTKTAAAYGLRRMRGRMKKEALSVLDEGVKHNNAGIRDVSSNALTLLKRQDQAESGSQDRIEVGNLKITEIRKKRSNLRKARMPNVRRRGPVRN